MRRAARRALVVGLVLAVQVLVPLRALLDERDRVPFGWSMYASQVNPPEVALVLGDGAVRPVPIGEIVVRRRPEIDYAGELPPYLCERYPVAREVRIEVDSQELEVTPCP